MEQTHKNRPFWTEGSFDRHYYTICSEYDLFANFLDKLIKNSLKNHLFIIYSASIGFESVMN